MTDAADRTLRLADVAAAVGGTLVGDGDVRVRGISALDRAGPDDLSFLSGAKYAPLLAECAAAAVLVSPEFAEAPGRCVNRVIVAKPHEAMLALLPKLYEMPTRPFEGVHPSAAVAADAVIDPTACVEAFAVIGARATIGRGVWVGPHCVVGDGVRVGADARLVSHVTLYPGADIGERTILHAGVRIASDGFGYVFDGGQHRKLPHVGGCLIGNDVEIGANSCVDRGSIDATVIGDGTKIDNLVHVAHNVRVGRRCLLVAGTGIAGSVPARGRGGPRRAGGGRRACDDRGRRGGRGAGGRDLGRARQARHGEAIRRGRRSRRCAAMRRSKLPGVHASGWSGSSRASRTRERAPHHRRADSLSRRRPASRASRAPSRSGRRHPARGRVPAR
jgi:UDP-3-O-[3-hydroxymyristoyl] glucosamine N-acyltransferase